MTQPASQRSLAALSSLFENFAERECRTVSPLYYQLAKEVAQEPYLLQLASKARPRQPIPNLFFGAVHYLLLLQPRQKLAKYYPSIKHGAGSIIPVAVFLDFCKNQEAELIHLLQNRIVQTNALNRTAYLMPIASSRFRDCAGLNLVDIGSSSGLTMNFDQYRYTYNSEMTVGEGRVQIQSKILEGTLPVFTDIVTVKRKIGIDQNPLDLKITDNATWLKALIWPDLQERFLRMEAAIQEARQANISILAGSKIDDFRTVIDRIPREESLLVYHTHVLYQFSPMERLAFRHMMDEIGASRNFLYLAVEGHSIFDNLLPLAKGIQMILTTYQQGIKTVEHLGTTDGHATWIRWKRRSVLKFKLP
ncbi:MAG: DUF2332 domain-containing protein [Saprospiraceae bacterium]|nr:DUF2332 domain-containing protein [Saprospiraceae bacterium]